MYTNSEALIALLTIVAAALSIIILLYYADSRGRAQKEKAILEKRVSQLEKQLKDRNHTPTAQ